MSHSFGTTMNVMVWVALAIATIVGFSFAGAVRLYVTMLEHGPLDLESEADPNPAALSPHDVCSLSRRTHSPARTHARECDSP